jgi:predicted transcriptional regulator
MTVVTKASAKNETPVSPRKGGRAKAFDEETVKVALFLPPDLVGTLKALAARRRLTPSLVVAEWIERAEVREAIARGRQAFEKGDVVSHAEALRRLAKW